MADSAAVVLWRNKFRLNLSQSWKEDVDKTVTDVELWREILNGWGYYKNGRWIKKSPGIKQLLTEYERLEQDKHDHEASVVSARSREGISERSYSDVSEVRSGTPSLYFRTRDMVR
jgi:hypothetical protein